MQKKVQDIAQVISGYTFRSPVEKDPNGKVFVLQATNVDSARDITETGEFARISSEPPRAMSYLEYNDVLLVSRGSGLGSFRATVFALDETNVIASSSVHIIRIKDVTVLPKYISLYLNSDDGQKKISQVVTGGSYIQSILRKNLEDIDIPIPPMIKQKSIIALHENIKRQEEILERKSYLKKNIISATFKNLTTK
ncbi:MAG: restriction endonuclease subunit S [Patescibacteria group bacterium]